MFRHKPSLGNWRGNFLFGLPLSSNLVLSSERCSWSTCQFYYSPKMTQMSHLCLLWCPRLDLNQHALRHMLLRHTCIPISPHGHIYILTQKRDFLRLFLVNREPGSGVLAAIEYIDRRKSWCRQDSRMR